MKLTNYIVDLGRIVAYYPNLKQVTTSTTATIFLCQLIYWINKTEDGWIYKDSFDIEEETGLTYYEQQGARKILLGLGLISEQYKRLDHKIAFMVNQERLNDLWEQNSGKMSNPRYANKEEEPIPVSQPVDLRDFQDPKLHPENAARHTDAIKKGDLVDAYIDFAKTPGARKEMAINKIRDTMESKFHINMANKKWEHFIEYVYGRQERHDEPADKFINWALKQGFDPMYWTPEKCETMYPMAFVEDAKNKPREDFVEKPPEHIEKKVAPMPDDVKHKRKLT